MMKVLCCLVLLLVLASAHKHNPKRQFTALTVLVDIDGGPSCQLNFNNKGDAEKGSLEECVASIVSLPDDTIKVCRTETDCEISSIYYDIIVFDFNKKVNSVTGVYSKLKAEAA